jgi:hypothetical protein
MTREEAEKLPALIDRAVFMEITGLSAVGMGLLREEGRIRWFAVGRKKRRGKYFRADAFRLAGWEK